MRNITQDAPYMGTSELQKVFDNTLNMQITEDTFSYAEAHMMALYMGLVSIARHAQTVRDELDKVIEADKASNAPHKEVTYWLLASTLSNLKRDVTSTLGHVNEHMCKEFIKRSLSL